MAYDDDDLPAWHLTFLLVAILTLIAVGVASKLDASGGGGDSPPDNICDDAVSDNFSPTPTIRFEHGCDGISVERLRFVIEHRDALVGAPWVRSATALEPWSSGTWTGGVAICPGELDVPLQRYVEHDSGLLIEVRVVAERDDVAGLPSNTITLCWPETFDLSYRNDAP